MVKGENHRTTIVCIDSYAKGVPRGRLYNLYLKEIQTFESLSQLLFMIERGLDELRFPQAFEAIRRFDTPAYDLPKEEYGLWMMCGRAATFSIKILFRRNASWQGSLNWLEGNTEQSFRSVLELVSLMDSALVHDRVKQLES